MLKIFLRQNIVVLILLNSGNFCNYLFQVVVGRALDPAEYGSLNSLAALLSVIMAPASVMPVVFAKFTIELGDTARIRNLISTCMKGMGLIALVVPVGATLFTGTAMGYLKLTEPTPYLIMLLNLSVALLLPPMWGVLQGLSRFTYFGVASAGAMFIRLAIAFVALRLFGQGINAALSAWTFGLIFELAISALALRDVMRVPAAPLPAGIFRRMVRFAIPALASTTMFIFMWNVDIILARLYCSPYDSGLYANAAIIGHIALFLPAALVNVLLPHVAKAHKEGLSGGGALAASLALCVVLSGGFCLLCLIWSEEIISLLFGAKFIPAAPILQLLSPAMALLSLCNVLINFSMARNRFSFIKVLALGAGLVPALVYAFHADGRTIALIMLGVSALILAGITLTLTIEERKQA